LISFDSFNQLDDARILITGGTGSLGKKLTRTLLDHTKSTTILIYSRDEFKQFEMAKSLTPDEYLRLRFMLGDVRDLNRLRRALDGVDYVIHAAALKQVPAAEYNPSEFVLTNIHGADNLINASIDQGVKNVVALSTDKAANPVNLYGATKLCSDKLFVAGNFYSGSKETRFSVVRYGNVVGSRGSVIPFFLNQYKEGVLPITDNRMTRFWITLEQGVALVLMALTTMKGREIWVPKIPSMKILDLARVIGPDCEMPEIGIRPGEKLHEVMIPIDDGRHSVEYENYFIITPPQNPMLNDKWVIENDGKTCADDFYYGSDNNTQWVSEADLTQMIKELDAPEARAWAQERGL